MIVYYLSVDDKFHRIEQGTNLIRESWRKHETKIFRQTTGIKGIETYIRESDQRKDEKDRNYMENIIRDLALEIETEITIFCIVVGKKHINIP